MNLELADDGGVRWIWFNRPDRLNALARDLLEELRTALHAAAGDPAIGCIVLAGRGKAFSAGGDLSLVGERRAALQLAHAAQDTGPVIDAQIKEAIGFAENIRLLFASPKPTLAALHGPVAGGALCLALACDFRIAAANARLRPAFLKIGLSGDFGVSFLLQELLGRARALEVMVLHDELSGAQAQALGLATQAVPPEELQDRTAEMARRLAALPPLAYDKMKQNLNLGRTEELARVIEREAINSRLCALSRVNADFVRRFE